MQLDSGFPFTEDQVFNIRRDDVVASDGLPLGVKVVRAEAKTLNKILERVVADNDDITAQTEDGI